MFLSMEKSTAQSLIQLKIGDTLPPLNVSYLFNDSVKSVPLSELYKNSFLIIDFWATWCSACIKAMAHADSLSKQFGGKLSILPVTYQDLKTVRDFVTKNKTLSRLNLKYVVNDSVLMGGYFKFLSIPHEVWVDTIGVVRGITYPDEITHQNIKLFVNNEKLFLQEKRENVEFNILEEMLPVDNNFFMYRSVLTEHKPELNHMIGSLTDELYLKDAKLNRFFAINESILNLFYMAYSKGYGGRIEFKRIELQIKDSFSLFPSFKAEQVTRKTTIAHTFCYELVLPNKVSEKLFYSYLLDDLNRIFPYKASIEKRTRPCWIIVNKERIKNPTTMGNKSKLTWQRGFLKQLINQPMDALVSYLDWNMDTLRVIDESNFKKPFDMNLDAIINYNTGYLDIQRIRNSLRKYGFDLIKTERFVDILIIREKEK